MFFLFLSGCAGYEEKNKGTIDFVCKVIYLLIYNHEHFLQQIGFSLPLLRVTTSFFI